MPGVMRFGESIFLPFSINQTDLLAPTDFDMVSPIAGVIKGFTTVVQVAVTTGGAVKLTKGASTDVVGASITLADGATKGTIQSAVATEGSATRVVAAGERIRVVPAAAINTAGAINGFIEISSGN